MAIPTKPGSNFGLISGIVGLTLCLAQTIKGHNDSVNERERLQEAHEQKMHFLHEFHRQQLHAKDHEMNAREHQLSAREMERRAKEAEERVERMARSVMEGRFRMSSPQLGVSTIGRDGAETLGNSGDGRDVKIVAADGNDEKEREVWRLMGSAREDVDDENTGERTGQEDHSGATGVVEEMEKNRYQ